MTPCLKATAPPYSAELPSNSPLKTTLSKLSKKLTPPPYLALLLMKLLLNVILCGVCL
jgi:hypothetical protein